MTYQNFYCGPSRHYGCSEVIFKAREPSLLLFGWTLHIVTCHMRYEQKPVNTIMIVLELIIKMIIYMYLDI